MKRILIPFLALAAVSCGTESSPEVQESAKPVITGEMLRDSASDLSFDAETMAEKQNVVALYEQAIEMEPNNRDAYLGKLSMLSGMGDDQALLTALEETHNKFSDDPFIALHLGMEYELQNAMDKAQPLYEASLNNFLTTLDTMGTEAALVRNSYLMNLALANVLAELKKDEADIKAVLSEDELKNYETTKTQLATMDHLALLNLRK